MKHLISVIIPVFNEQESIGECLKSLLGQTYKDIEIIVVDDGSTDATLDVVRSVNADIKILKQSHKGPGEARNLGVSKAKGIILVFVDADMTFDKDFISNLTEPIRKKKTKGTFSKNEMVSNWDNVWARCWNFNKNIENNRMHTKNYPDKQRVFRAILTSEFKKAGGFTKGGHYTDDWSLYEKLGYEAIAAKNALFYHKNPESLKEVFLQARWAAKRKYKLGFVGYFIVLARFSFPVSVAVGVYKSIKYSTLHFLVFKIVYDFASTIGILEYVLFAKGGK